MKRTKFKCPNPKCGTILSLSSEMQGCRARCAACGKQLRVPVTGPIRSARRTRFRKAG